MLPRSKRDGLPKEGQSLEGRSGRVRGFLIAGFSLVGLVHVFLASTAAQVSEIPLTAQFGLLQVLPAGYWVGLSLIGFAVSLSVLQRNEPLIVATGCVLLATFAGTPSLFEPNPRYWDSYLHFGEAQMALLTGGLPEASLGQYVGNWPGFFLFAAAESSIGAIPALALLKLHPFLAGGLTFLAIFVFLRATFPRPVAGPGAVLASLFAVWAQYHVSPQSMGFILLLLILGFLWRREAPWRFSGALLFMGLVVSHPTSTLVLLTILVLLAFFGLFWGRRSRDARSDARFVLIVTAAYSAAWFAWLFFHATGSEKAIEVAIFTRMGELVNLPEQTLNLATARATENLFVLPPRVRSASLAAYGILALVALIGIVRAKKRRRLSRFLLASLVGISLLAGADLVAFNGQFYDRSLLFFATIAPAVCLTGLRRVPFPKVSRRVIFTILLGASLAAASTTYYQEVFNQVSGESLAASEFLQQVPSNSVLLGGMFPTPVWLDPGNRALIIRVPLPEGDLPPIEDLGGSFKTYVGFDRTGELWYRQWLGIDIYRFYEREVADHPRIYDNGKAQFYYIRSLG